MRFDFVGLIRNTSEVELCGGFREVFFAECKKNGICLRILTAGDDLIRTTVLYQQLQEVNNAAAHAGMELVCKKNKGPYFIYKKYRRRMGLVFGIALAVMLCIILSGIVWSIEITGTEALNEELLLMNLKEKGVKTGMFTAQVNCNEIERYVESSSASVLHATSNLVGCRLYINVKERTLPPDNTPEGVYSDLIASDNGEIVLCNVFAGVQVVKTGDAVRKGDLLVSGVQPLKNGGTRYLHPQAEIKAKTTKEIQIHIPHFLNCACVCKVKNKTAICFFGLRIPSKANDYEGDGEFLNTKSTVFPIGLQRYCEKELKAENIKLTPRQTVLIGLTDFAIKAKDYFAEAEILDCAVKTEFSRDAIMYITLTCIENICGRNYYINYKTIKTE